MKNHLIYLSVLLLMGTSCNHAKQLLKQVDEREVVQKEKGYWIEAEVKHFDIKPKIKKEYHWFWKGKIQENYGGYNGTLLHGEYVKYDSDKNMLEKAFFKKGLQIKKQIIWNKNGTYSSIQKWRNGRLTGKYALYNDEGNLIEKGKNKKGEKHGKINTYSDGEQNELVYKKGMEIIKPIKEKDEKEKKDKPKKQQKSKKENNKIKEKTKKSKKNEA